MVRKTTKPKKHPDTCPRCGSAQLTVWLDNGGTVAVDPKKIEVVFCNQAMAGGAKLPAYLEHKCKGGKR